MLTLFVLCFKCTTPEVLGYAFFKIMPLIKKVTARELVGVYSGFSDKDEFIADTTLHVGPHLLEHYNNDGVTGFQLSVATIPDKIEGAWWNILDEVTQQLPTGSKTIKKVGMSYVEDISWNLTYIVQALTQSPPGIQG